MFNAAFLSAPVVGERQLDRRIATARVHFDARQQAWSYWVCEDWLDKKARRSVDATFKRHGLHLATVLPGMVADKLAAPVRPLPQLEVRPWATAKPGRISVRLALFASMCRSAGFRKSSTIAGSGRPVLKAMSVILWSEPVSTAGIVLACGARREYAT